MSTVPYELYLEESACVHEVKAVQGFILNRIVFTCRPIGKRSYALRSPSAVLHLRYRAFRHRRPFKKCRPSPSKAPPDRRSVPLF